MSRKLTVQNRSGYGKQLRQRLEIAGITQGQLADAASISRQTIHRAITRDEVSTKTATRIDAVLGGRANERGTQASRAWANATDLIEWSKRRDAQEDLPRMIRRLIHVTVDGVRHMSFRAGEGIQLGGWDGRLLTDAGNAFVPQGESVWEMGTTLNAKLKASEDYAKRTESPGPDVDPSKTTFVFVTSRRFAQKDEWSASHRSEGRWKEVRVIDADDLEAWLESAPSVHLWLSARIGVFPDSGAQDLESWLNNWSRATHPRLTPAFLLAGRERSVEDIAKWRTSAALTEPLEILSESRTESIAVFAATLDDEAIARAVVVNEENAWRRLVATRIPLILIALFDPGDETMAGVRAGHAIVVPLGQGDVARPNAILLPPVAVDTASNALLTELQAVENEKATARARDQVDEWARLARRSMTAFRRRIGRSPTLRIPEWASPATARTILPALFAGSWSEKSAGDREFLETVAMKPYTQVADDLEKWAHGADPAVRHRGGRWYVVSREDAWELLGKYVQIGDSERFYAAALAVLSTPDPRYELPLDQQWMAGVIGKKAAHSDSLRGGIAATLALVPAPQSARLVRDLLRKANIEWKVWASLSSILSDVAEAAPDEFLSALEVGLRDPGAPIARFFTDSNNTSSGAHFSSSPHTGLLWALERLAWAPRHLAQVTEVLSELAKRDPGGQLMNRPSASLQAIFRVMLPQTMAPLAQRFRVLDRLAERDPQRAWDVLRSSLPRFQGSYMSSARPKWRDWADEYDPGRRITRAEYDEAVTGTLDRLMKLAKRDGARWASLIAALPQLDSAQYEKIVIALRTLEGLDSADRSAIWDALRKVAGQFRAFPDAKWTLPPQSVSAIDELRARFTPTDPAMRYGWLFGWRADLPDATAPRKDHKAYQDQVNERRLTAVLDVFQESGLSGLFELAKGAEHAEFVGDAAAEAALLEATLEDDLLVTELGGERHRDLFARGYARTRQRLHDTWVGAKVARAGSRLRPEQLAALLGVLPSERETWALVASMGSDIEQQYWKSQHFLNNDEDLEFAVEKLLDFGQVSMAFSLMGAYVSAQKVSVRSELVLEVLERISKGEGDIKQLPSDFGWNLAELLSQLSEDASVDRGRLVQLEWVFLPILEGHDRSPKTLHDALASNASFFVELISAIFRGDGDSKKADSEISEEDRERTSRAYQLLQSWRTVPPNLREWVLTARRLLVDARRLGIGDEQIGQVLSGASSDPDGTWPPKVVRDVIEEVRSDDLEDGIIVGKYNLRGVTSRAIGEGGVQEHAIADQHEGLATAVEDSAPRTARMLRQMAKSYRAEAVQEDLSASIEADIGS